MANIDMLQRSGAGSDMRLNQDDVDTKEDMLNLTTIIVDDRNNN